jgi:adenylate kinase family enzyme
MKKIVIIGSSGAGKTTLAKALGSQLRIKVFHLDRFFWTRNWDRKSTYERMEILEKLTFGENRWIIEGTYLRSSEPGLREADTIIFGDLPFHLCFRRVIKRHYENQGSPRRDIPEGCADRFTLRHLLKTLAFPVLGRRMIEQILHKCPSKHVIRLYSKKEVEHFLAQPKQIEEDEKALAVQLPR